MNRILLSLVIIVILFSCEKNPCDQLIDGTYQYPERSEVGYLTLEQHLELLNLPEETLDCIITEGLIETCLNYPELRMIWTRNSPQEGYDYVHSHFNGLRELDKRNDAPKFLLKKYKNIEPKNDNFNLEALDGHYLFNLCYFVLIFSQYTNLESLTINEKIELIEKSDSLYNELINYPFTQQPIIALMGRLMYKDQFQPFIIRFFRELIQNPAYVARVTEFFVDYLKRPKAPFEFENHGEYVQYVKDQNFQTYKHVPVEINGRTTYKMEVVKSIEECKICSSFM